jgi:hypothetical protein
MDGVTRRNLAALAGLAAFSPIAEAVAAGTTNADNTNPDATLEYIGNRIAIDDVLTRYSIAIDDEDFELLDTVFAPDAILDYMASGGPRAPYPEVRAWLIKGLRSLHPGKMHVIAQRQVILEGNTARVRAYFFNPYAIQWPEGSWVYSLGGGFYDHKMERRPEGWRSVELREHTVWRDANTPIPHPHAARSKLEWDFGGPARPKS